MLNELITDVILEGTNCSAFEGTDFHSNWAHYGLLHTYILNEVY